MFVVIDGSIQHDCERACVSPAVAQGLASQGGRLRRRRAPGRAGFHHWPRCRGRTGSRGRRRRRRTGHALLRRRGNGRRTGPADRRRAGRMGSSGISISTAIIGIIGNTLQSDNLPLEVCLHIQRPRANAIYNGRKLSGRNGVHNGRATSSGHCALELNEAHLQRPQVRNELLHRV